MEIIAIGVFLASCGGSSHVTGRVTMSKDAPIAGARVTVDGVKTHREFVTDAAGRFDTSQLAAGAYNLKVEQPGFVMEARSVAVARGATATADFVLRPACLSGGTNVDGGLAWALQAAQAVLHVRIGTASAPDRWIAYDDSCVIGIDHTVSVISILNMGEESGSIPATIHVVKDGSMPFGRGEEYIAFVRWEPAMGRYRPVAGEIFMIPVRDDTVVWNRTDAPTIHDGDNVTEVMAALHAMLRK